jgi:hypothetical protein
MVSHFPSGITDDRTSVHYDFPALNPSRVYGISQNGDEYLAGNYTVTTTGSGTATIVSGKGGLLTLTNGASNGDNIFLQWKGGNATTVESFLFEANKRLVFKSRFKVDNVTNSRIVIGLQSTDTTPLSVSDGVYFIRSSSTASFSLVLAKAGTLTTIASIGTMVNDTFIELGFYYNGKNKIEIFVNGVKTTTATDLTNLPIVPLTLSFGVQNGSGVSRVMSINYIHAHGEF